MLCLGPGLGLGLWLGVGEIELGGKWVGDHGGSGLGQGRIYGEGKSYDSGLEGRLALE